MEPGLLFLGGPVPLQIVLERLQRAGADQLTPPCWVLFELECILALFVPVK
jgi:hypothetical protein